MQIFGLKNCDACRNALKSLRSAGYDVNLHDVRDEPLTDGQIARFWDAFGEAIVNRRSATWRQMNDDERAGDPKVMLAKWPTLMKRPVIKDDAGQLHLGWNSADWTAQA